MMVNITQHVLDFIRAPVGKDFNTLALQVFAHQFIHNAPYQRFCLSRGQTPELVARWQDIPAVPTVAFKELDLTGRVRSRFWRRNESKHRQPATIGQQTRGEVGKSRGMIQL